MGGWACKSAERTPKRSGSFTAYWNGIRSATACRMYAVWEIHLVMALHVDQ